VVDKTIQLIGFPCYPDFKKTQKFFFLFFFFFFFFFVVRQL